VRSVFDNSVKEDSDGWDADGEVRDAALIRRPRRSFMSDVHAIQRCVNSSKVGENADGEVRDADGEKRKETFWRWRPSSPCGHPPSFARN
jgi:hypothetical protein